MTTAAPITTPANDVASVEQITTVDDAANPHVGFGTINPADSIGYQMALVIKPGSMVNGGVGMSWLVPTFVRERNGDLTPARSSDIRVGDTIEFWHDDSYVTGITGYPPTARFYSPTQIAIDP